MPTGPAARLTDPVLHPLPLVLTPGLCSNDVIIGFLKAWRGIPLAAVAALQSAKAASDAAIQTAEAATLAAAGTPGAPAAKAAEEATKATCLATMSAAITGAAACGADIHQCTTPLPIPPHGPGVIIDGSPTVMINFLPACRMGDTILEALGPPNKVAKGEMTVIIGQSGSGGGGGGGGGGPQILMGSTTSVPGGITANVGVDATPQTRPPANQSAPSGGGGSSSSKVAADSLTEAAESGTPLIEPCPGCEALGGAAE